MPALRHRLRSHVTLVRKPDDTALNRLPGQHVTKVLGPLCKTYSVQGINIASAILQRRQVLQRRVYNPFRFKTTGCSYVRSHPGLQFVIKCSADIDSNTTVSIIVDHGSRYKRDGPLADLLDLALTSMAGSGKPNNFRPG